MLRVAFVLRSTEVHPVFFWFVPFPLPKAYTSFPYTGAGRSAIAACLGQLSSIWASALASRLRCSPRAVLRSGVCAIMILPMLLLSCSIRSPTSTQSYVVHTATTLLLFLLFPTCLSAVWPLRNTNMITTTTTTTTTRTTTTLPPTPTTTLTTTLTTTTTTTAIVMIIVVIEIIVRLKTQLGPKPGQNTIWPKT